MRIKEFIKSRAHKKTVFCIAGIGIAVVLLIAVCFFAIPEEQGNNTGKPSGETQKVIPADVTKKAESEQKATSAPVEYKNLPEDDYVEYRKEIDNDTSVLLLCSSPGAGLMNKYLFWSKDGGESWENGVDISSAVLNYPVDVLFVTEEKGYVLTDYHGYEDYLYMTEDGGKSWETVTLDDSGFGEYRYAYGKSMEYDKKSRQIAVTVRVLGKDDTEKEYTLHLDA